MDKWIIYVIYLVTSPQVLFTLILHSLSNIRRLLLNCNKYIASLIVKPCVEILMKQYNKNIMVVLTKLSFLSCNSSN